MKNNFKLKILFVFCLFLFLFLIAGECLAATCAEKYPNDGTCSSACEETTPEDKETGLCPADQTCCHKYAAPAEINLQVPIFGYARATDLSEYIVKIYEYSLSVITILAIFVIFYAGFLWLTSGGDGAKIRVAKSYIVNAILGIIIAYLAAFILALIGIQELKPLKVLAIKEIDSPDTDAPLSTAIANIPGEIFCPKSGGSSNLKTVAQSTIGKITYRFGGKGGAPPYAEKVGGEYYKYNNYCPAGTICLDCSGYINFVLKCAGLNQYSGGTAQIFGCNCSSSERIMSCNAESINGIQLKPGDVVGYPSCNDRTGHVYIYGGSGKLYESHGGTSGRQPGGSVATSQLCAHSWTGMGRPTCVKRL